MLVSVHKLITFSQKRVTYFTSRLVVNMILVLVQSKRCSSHSQFFLTQSNYLPLHVYVVLKTKVITLFVGGHFWKEISVLCLWCLGRYLLFKRFEVLKCAVQWNWFGLNLFRTEENWVCLLHNRLCTLLNRKFITEVSEIWNGCWIMILISRPTSNTFFINSKSLIYHWLMDVTCVR